MKILIFYASYGGGHLNAAKSINEYILNNYKENEVELIDCMKYVNKTFEKVTTAAYRETAKRAPWVWGRIYADSQRGPLAHLSSRSNKIMAIKLLRLLRSKQPDLIISTHPFGSQMCSYLKRKGKINSKIATVMTDFAPHDQWLVGSDYTDYYFVAHNGMKDSLIKHDIDESKIYSSGIPLSSRFLQNFDRKEILDHFNLKDNKLNILFFGGGEFGLGKTKTLEFFNTIVKFCSNMQIIAISGKNEKMKIAFEEIVKDNNAEDYVKILGFTNQVPQLMSICDLVVSKPGGMTTTEALASNLPILIINPIPGQEEENAHFLESNGVGIWITKNTNLQGVLDDLFSTPDKLKQMKENTKSLSNPYSTKTICDILLK